MKKLFNSETYMIDKNNKNFLVELVDDGSNIEIYAYSEDVLKRVYIGLIEYARQNVSKELAIYKGIQIVQEDFENIYERVYSGTEEIIDGISVIEYSLYDYSMFKISDEDDEIIFEIRDDGSFVEAFKLENDGSQTSCYFNESCDCDVNQVKKELKENFIKELKTKILS